MRLSTMVAVPLLALLAGLIHGQEPGDKIKARTAKDIDVLMPQNGVGGTDKLQVESVEPTIKDIKIEFKGCEKATGHVAYPAGMDRNRKHALVVTFTDGTETAKSLREIAKISGGKDPLIFCAMTFAQWKKIEENFLEHEWLVDRDALSGGYAWMMKKVMADYPVDPERVFLLGTEGGHGGALELAQQLWAEDADAFPFRAILLDGHVGASYSEAFPPVPYILASDTLFMSRNSGWLEGTRRFVNELISHGLPAQYHEYRGSVTGTAPRRVFILRDSIAVLGGPGAPEYPKERPMPGVITDVDKLPWTVDNAPANTRDVVVLMEQEQWVDARERLAKMLDQKMAAKEKRELKAFEKDFDKYVKNEMDRCHASVANSVKADMWPHQLHQLRLKAMYKAFKDEKWAQSKKYGETLEALKTFGPAVRDEARKQEMLKAAKLELEGKRDEAKKIYEALVKQQKEDGGVSDWPFAAEYRLSWWTE